MIDFHEKNSEVKMQSKILLKIMFLAWNEFWAQQKVEKQMIFYADLLWLPAQKISEIMHQSKV